MSTAPTSPLGREEPWRGLDPVRDAGHRVEIDAVARVRSALGHLRSAASTSELFHIGTHELCRTCGFDRAIAFRVDGSEAVIENVHFENAPAWADDIRRLGRLKLPPSEHPLREATMMHRREAVLIEAPAADPRTFKPLVLSAKMTSYVAAPIFAREAVIGFFQADCFFSSRRVGPLDRESLWAFSEGFGYAFEHAALVERMDRELDRVRAAVTSPNGTLAQGRPLDAAAVHEPVRPSSNSSHGSWGSSAAGHSDAEELLTARELEVLRLLARGATNARVAEVLVISEGTVKSHVKHVLRKLEAGNRVEAVSRYLLQMRPERRARAGLDRRGHAPQDERRRA